MLSSIPFKLLKQRNQSLNSHFRNLVSTKPRIVNPSPSYLFLGAPSPVLCVYFPSPDYTYVILSWNIWNFLLTVLTLRRYICNSHIFLMDGSLSNMNYHLYFTSFGLRTTLSEAHLFQLGLSCHFVMEISVLSFQILCIC